MGNKYYINGRLVIDMPEGCGNCPLLDKDDNTAVFSDGYCTYLKRRKKRYAKVNEKCRRMFINHFENIGIKNKNP